MGADPPGRRFAPVFKKRPPNPPTQGTDGGVRENNRICEPFCDAGGMGRGSSDWFDDLNGTLTKSLYFMVTYG